MASIHRRNADAVHRWRAALLVALGVATGVYPGRAEPVSVPPELQARLLSKVAKYDRNLAARAGDRVRVLIVFRRGDADSERTGQQLDRALRGLEDIGGIPQQVTLAEYTGAAALRESVAKGRVAVVYLASGFSRETPQIAQSFAGLDLLTVSAQPSDVLQGIVLGFDLVSGKPTVLVQLTVAKRQNVAIAPQALKLMKVYR